MVKYIHLIFIIIIFSFTAFAQESFKYTLAEKYFNRGEYVAALEIYEELVNKKQPNYIALRKAALCNTYIRNYKQALKDYEELESVGHADNQDYIEYAKLLQRAKKYDKAQEYYKKYLNKNNNSVIAENYVNAPNYIEELYKDSSNYIIKKAYKGSMYSEFSPVLYKGDTLYATNNRNTALRNNRFSRDNSYFIHLESNSEKKEVQELINQVANSKYHNGPITFDSNYQRMYFTRNSIERGLNKRRLQLHTSILENGKWSQLQSVTLSDTSYSIGHAALDGDSVIYFVSDMPGGYGKTDIWKASIQNGAIGRPINLGKVINTEEDELFPYVTDEGHLIYSSNGLVGLGGLDFFFAIKSRGTFNKVYNMGYPLNSHQDDFGIYINEKEQSGLFSSDRLGEAMKDDIFPFTYDHLFTTEETVLCKVFDEDSAAISMVKITVFQQNENDEWKKINITQTDENGKWEFVFNPNEEYKITFESPLYQNEILFMTSDKENDIDTIKNNMLIKNKSGGQVTDEITGKPIEGTQVTLYTRDNEGEWIEIEISSTDELGNWDFDYRDDYEYKVEVNAENYKSLEFTFPAEEYNRIKLTPKSDFGSIIRIDNIYFNHGSARVLEESYPVLENIVSFLNNNPKIKVELSAHTSCIGSDSFNLKLSKRRAKNCRSILIKKGISPERLTSQGYGESQMLNSCKIQRENEEAARINRRVELKVL